MSIQLETVLATLKGHARPEQLAGMARFGIIGDNRLGVAIPVLRKLARTIGRQHPLALALWRTEIPDARILAGMVADSERLTARQMEAWVKDFDSWDVCDQVCLNLFVKSPHAWAKVQQWSDRPAEYVKRAAFALLACLAVHDKAALDAQFLGCLPLLQQAATDERNYVKKAVNWALRQIGKRNRRLNRAAIQCAKTMQKMHAKAARWIAADALRQLTGEMVRKRIGH